MFYYLCIVFFWVGVVVVRGYIQVEGLRLEQSVIFAVSHTVTTI